jgi:hypothetical protein
MQWFKSVILPELKNCQNGNQTHLGENLQFCFKTEGFQSHYSVVKTFSFSLKTEGNTNCSV